MAARAAGGPRNRAQEDFRPKRRLGPPQDRPTAASHGPQSAPERERVSEVIRRRKGASKRAVREILHRRGRGSSPGPPWRPSFCGNNGPRPIAPRLGTPSRRRPSWTPSLWCAAACGWRLRVFHCPPPTLIYGKSRPLCTTGLSIPWLTPLELRKVQLVTRVTKK